MLQHRHPHSLCMTHIPSPTPLDVIVMEAIAMTAGVAARSEMSAKMQEEVHAHTGSHTHMHTHTCPPILLCSVQSSPPSVVPQVVSK